MKTLQKFVGLIALTALFASCQSPKQALSESDSRMEIMNNIASDHDMSKEMMQTIMSGDHGKMLMHERMNAMMEDKSMVKKMMKDNPEMSKRMMSVMMETAKEDTTMMTDMCKSMMKNPEMMEMMKKMKEKESNQ
ncbi:hypothetical protein [Aquiflexum gelatinilyticum]|uniref:hypothetical protein n=1 Tax=Aquiflexum gelatinilyticum TaxID=2961943 RepID=UPI002167A875|nr:hypothetical protein [Aquiflexum gelatinilyticum]MCS4435883.1 hypothetical protein [Aquiflexum gelatinilyticum]